MVRTYIMIVGLPGSGKSEVAKNFADYFEKVHHVKPYLLSKDDIREELTGNRYDRSRNKEVNKIYEKKLIMFRKGKISTPVMIDYSCNYNVFKRANQIKIMQTKRRDSSIAKPYICAIYLDRPDGYCEERIKRNGLEIPEQVMKRLNISIQKPIAREGFHHIFTLRKDGTVKPSLWFDNFITWGRWIK